MGAKPIGAELWASFHPPPPQRYNDGNGTLPIPLTASEVEAAADGSWHNLTGLLSGQFCASLSRLDRTEVGRCRLTPA